jgi:hypothetical protein
MADEDVNIFKESTYDYYFIRPESLENTKYIDYFKNYGIILKYSKKKLPVKAKKIKDKKGELIFIIKKKNVEASL